MKKEIYLKSNGKIDRLTTFLNNHEYLTLILIIICFCVGCLIESVL